MENEDHKLAEALKDENLRKDAFQQLVRLYQEKLYWHIRKMVINHDDTDDVLQNTFLKVWNNISGFRQESTLYTWLYRIATNEAITFLNSKKRRTLLPLQDINDQLINNLKSDPYFEGDKIQMKLQQAILGLPEKQRIVFNMKYFDEMKYEDMSKILDTSVGALKASFHHAVKKIEEYLLNTD
jgi:RNA polymerase sigma-70 factor (ECF subfamily)